MLYAQRILNIPRKSLSWSVSCILLTIMHTLDNYVVHIYLYGFSKDRLKNFVYQLLVGSPNILQPEGHYLITVQSLVGYNGCLLLILGAERNLMRP